MALIPVREEILRLNGVYRGRERKGGGKRGTCLARVRSELRVSSDFPWQFEEFQGFLAYFFPSTVCQVQHPPFLARVSPL